MFVRLDYLRLGQVLGEIRERKQLTEEYGAAYTAEGVSTLAGSRLYTSMPDTDDVVDDALARCAEVLENATPVAGSGP